MLIPGEAASPCGRRVKGEPWGVSGPPGPASGHGHGLQGLPARGARGCIRGGAIRLRFPTRGPSIHEPFLLRRPVWV